MIHATRLLVVLALAFLCQACSDDPELPPASPLATEASVIDKLYGAREGPYDITVIRDLTFHGTGEASDILLNLYFPTEGQDFPLVLFSHGTWSDKDSYDRVIMHWVSHGYTVIAPNHLDCCSAVQGIFNSLRYGQVGLVQGRIDDLSRLLDGIDELETLAPGFAGKADSSRIAAAGHSFGAFSAQQLGGARVFDPDQETYLSSRDPRIKAVVALSPPGPMFDTITEGSWTTLEAPTLVSTGTWDVQPRFWPDWRMHLMSFDTAVPGDKYALVIDGADHYLGNLICRTQRDAQPQEDALRMVQLTSTAFLDTFTGKDPSARAILVADRLADATGGFATLATR